MHFRQIFYLSLVFLPFFAWSQEQYSAYEILVKKADSLVYIDPKRGLLYAEEAHQLLGPKDENYVESLLLLSRLQRESRKTKEAVETLKKGLELDLSVDQKIQFFNEQSLNYFLLGNQDQRFVLLNKAWTLAQEFNLQKNHATVLNSLANHYTNQLQWDSAQFYFEKLIPFAQSKGGKLLGDYHFAQGYAFQSRNLGDTARHHYLAAIETYEKINLPVRAADVQRTLSILESNRDQYSEALAQLALAEKVYKRLNIEAKLANVYNHRAFIYRRTLQGNEALNYYKAALEIFKEQENQRDQAIAYLNLADLYRENFERPEEALVHIDSALANLSSTNYQNYFNKAVQHRAHILHDMQSYNAALKPLEEAYEYYLSKADTLNLFDNVVLAAQIHNKLGAYIKAEAKLLQANNMLSRVQNKTYRKNFYEAYLANQIALNNKEEANYALKQLIAAQKALSLETQKRQVNDLQVAYETAKKEEELVAQRAKNETMALVVAEKTRSSRWFLTSAVIMLIALLIVLYFFRRLNFKNKVIALLNKRLKKQNNELDDVNQALRQSNQQLAESNQAIKEKKDHIEQLHHEMNHRIKNNLQSLSATFFLQMDELDGEARSVMIEAQNRVDAMGLLHKSLYHDDQNPAFVNLPFYVEELLYTIEVAYDLEVPIKKNIEVKVDKLDTLPGIDICLMLNEIVNNSIKYAFPTHKEPSLAVKIYNANAHLNIEVHDNGPGLPEEFSLEKAKSFGMKLIHRFVQNHKGTCTIENEGGVRYKIALPHRKKKNYVNAQ